MRRLRRRNHLGPAVVARPSSEGAAGGGTPDSSEM